MSLDLKSEFGARAAKRLREEIAIWLTTVDAKGTPQPIPVWFLWDGETFLIYSMPDQAKLRNIARNPRVALNLDGDRGGDIIVATGEAEIVEGAPAAADVPEYVQKYAKEIERIGYDASQFATAYSVAIRVRPTRYRGF